MMNRLIKYYYKRMPVFKTGIRGRLNSIKLSFMTAKMDKKNAVDEFVPLESDFFVMPPQKPSHLFSSYSI